jgi:hypothetical protein
MYKGRVIEYKVYQFKVNSVIQGFDTLQQAKAYIDNLENTKLTKNIPKQIRATKNWIVIILIVLIFVVLFVFAKKNSDDSNTLNILNSKNSRIENYSTLNKISKWESLGFKKIAYCAATYGVASGFTNGQDVEEYKKKQNDAFALIYGISKKNSLDLDEVKEITKITQNWFGEKLDSYGNIMRQKKYTLPNGNIDTESFMVLVESEDDECNNYLNSVLASNRSR